MKFIKPMCQEYYINVANVRRFGRESFDNGNCWEVIAEMDNGTFETLEQFASHKDAMKYLDELVTKLNGE